MVSNPSSTVDSVSLSLETTFLSVLLLFQASHNFFPYIFAPTISFSVATLPPFNDFYNDEKNLTLLIVVVRVSSEKEILFMRICLDMPAGGQLNPPQDRDVYRNQTLEAEGMLVK